VLSVYAAIIRRLRQSLEPEVPKVLAAVFEPTLQMITINFEDYPEHRLRFFALLHAITNHCFKCLFAMSPPQLKLLIDSIIWAFRHTERNVAETGLLLLEVRARGARGGGGQPVAVTSLQDILKLCAGSGLTTQCL
jgi:exportin-1